MKTILSIMVLGLALAYWHSRLTARPCPASGITLTALVFTVDQAEQMAYGTAVITGAQHEEAGVWMLSALRSAQDYETLQRSPDSPAKVSHLRTVASQLKTALDTVESIVNTPAVVAAIDSVHARLMV